MVVKLDAPKGAALARRCLVVPPSSRFDITEMLVKRDRHAVEGHTEFHGANQGQLPVSAADVSIKIPDNQREKWIICSGRM